MPRPKPLVLIILDGWGYRAETKANAIALARKPTYDRLLREYPNTLLHTSGPFVGLPQVTGNLAFLEPIIVKSLGNATYNGLQTMFRKRFSGGLSNVIRQ